MTAPSVTRRGMLAGVVATAAGAVVGFFVARSSPAARAARGTTAAEAYGTTTQAAGRTAPQSGRLLLSLAQVPPGGGVIVPAAAIVVTRSPSGEVHAFSAVCTHAGCTVDSVANGTINCPCHGSRFDATTGAVRAGPAARPLPPVQVVVRSGNVYTS